MALKYSTEGTNSTKGRDGLRNMEREIGNAKDVDDKQPLQGQGQKTDPSVRLGTLTGPAAHGEVPMATTMRKPRAYRGKS